MAGNTELSLCEYSVYHYDTITGAGASGDTTMCIQDSITLTQAPLCSAMQNRTVCQVITSITSTVCNIHLSYIEPPWLS